MEERASAQLCLRREKRELKGCCSILEDAGKDEAISPKEKAFSKAAVPCPCPDVIFPGPAHSGSLNPNRNPRHRSLQQHTQPQRAKPPSWKQRSCGQRERTDNSLRRSRRLERCSRVDTTQLPSPPKDWKNRSAYLPAFKEAENQTCRRRGAARIINIQAEAQTAAGWRFPARNGSQTELRAPDKPWSCPPGAANQASQPAPGILTPCLQGHVKK